MSNVGNENCNNSKPSQPKTRSSVRTVEMLHLSLVCMSGMCGTEDKSRFVMQSDWHEMRISTAMAYARCGRGLDVQHCSGQCTNNRKECRIGMLKVVTKVDE